MATPTTTFKVHGPMFEKPAQVSLGFTEAVNRGLLDLATFEGANRVKEELYPGHGRVIGKLRSQVMASKVQDYLVQVDAGESVYGENLIYSNWVEGISSRNKTSTFKGYGMFQNAYDHINNNPQLYEDYIGDALIEAFD